MHKIHLPWQEIENVFLDMDGTLLDLHFDDHFWQDYLPRQYANKHGLDFIAALAELQPRFKAKEGSLQWYCIEHWSRELDMDVAALKKEIKHLIGIHDGVIKFLNTMRQMGKKVLLVTNAPHPVIELKLDHTGLHNYLDSIISSHDLGAPKEDQQFWLKFQAQEKFNKQHCLFVDDSLAVLNSAQRFGIKYIVAIAKPSSQRSAQVFSGFPMLKHFEDLLPTD